MKKLTVIFLFFVQFCGFEVLAQINSDSLTKYFDDGGISNAKNIVKVNLASTISGDASVFYERIVGSVFSVEVGTGLLLKHYIPDYYEFSNPDEISEIVADSIKGGYSLWFAPKIYYLKSAPELGYAGIQFRQRNYIMEHQNVTYNDVMFIGGFQKIIKKRLIMDLNFGVGIRLKKFKPYIDQEKFTSVSVGSFKIGYLF